MIIDSHLHVWSLERGDYDWLNPELGCLYADHHINDILPTFNTLNVTGCVLVQAAATAAETQFMLQQATNFPAVVAGVVGWLDLAADDACQQLQLMLNNPLIVGIRPMLQDISPDDWILQQQFEPVLTAMVDHQLVFDALVSQRQLPVVLELARRHPQLTIVLDHCGKPQLDEDCADQWLRDLQQLAAIPSVYIKLSGLPAQSNAPFNAARASFYVEHVAALFGAKRMLWGSDWPVLKLASEYGQWLSFCRQTLKDKAFSLAELNQVFYQNACDVYGLFNNKETLS